jgi:hypothetical protein
MSLTPEETERSKRDLLTRDQLIALNRKETAGMEALRELLGTFSPSSVLPSLSALEDDLCVLESVVEYNTRFFWRRNNKMLTNLKAYCSTLGLPVTCSTETCLVRLVRASFESQKKANVPNSMEESRLGMMASFETARRRGHASVRIR